jgi:hypothetical protein
MSSDGKFFRVSKLIDLSGLGICSREKLSRVKYVKDSIRFKDMYDAYDENKKIIVEGLYKNRFEIKNIILRRLK